MTLVIGVKCEDGVVLGADGIATVSTPDGIRTIEQEFASKIVIEQSDILVAMSGSVGLSQLMLEELRKHWGKIKKQRQVGGARNELSKAMWTQIRPSLERAAVAKAALGPNAIMSSICTSVFALPVQDEVILLAFDPQAASEEVTLDLPMISIGSGQQLADPFLAFVKRVIWNRKAPKTIADGIFGVLWTLLHVIEVNAGLGVGGYPTISVLQRTDDKWQAEFIEGERLDLHRQFILDAEESLREFLNGFNLGRDGINSLQ